MASKDMVTALNGICPYFTMFPLSFPYSILQRHASVGEWVIDPFCGRGTTNYASRKLGLSTVGIDSNPVAVAITQAKLANTTPQLIIDKANKLLEEISEPLNMPIGEFWQWAYHKEVLHTICRLREGLINSSASDTSKALRAILMGALHGPRGKIKQSYFSNQSQRTYAPKPGYAINFWKSRNLHPMRVDVMKIIEERAHRYFSQENTYAKGKVILGDSKISFRSKLPAATKFSWVITSPPYFGMDTYISDQWLRFWFIGAQPSVNYSRAGQLGQANVEVFTSNLTRVWHNIGQLCVPRARLVVRFGGINHRKADHLSIIKNSLKNSRWKITTIKAAGTASKGYRQSLHISSFNEPAIEEYDVWAIWE